MQNEHRTVENTLHKVMINVPEVKSRLFSEGIRVEDCVVFWFEVICVVNAETCTAVVGVVDIFVVALLSSVEFTNDRASFVVLVSSLAVVGSLVVKLLVFDWWLELTTVK